MRAAVKRIVRLKPELAPLNSLDTLLATIKANRGIAADTQLDLSFKHLLPFQALKNIDAASTLLAEMFFAKKTICIVGDFDTDGATSTALAVSALKVMGVAKVHFLVPNRFKFGYGLTPEIVEVAAEYQPALIITVDNGIASIEGVARANELGIQVLITDHHLPGNTLPNAAAIVNPNQVGDEFPSKNLAGVGVVFYVMMALRTKLRELGWFAQQNIPEPNLAQFLDLVALGTVADVVPLDHNNRILVNQGLLRIRAGESRPGINALIGLSKRRQSEVLASDLGFIVAPRLNAAGRMEDMSLGIDCLLAKTAIEAQALAMRLELLNQERRAVEADMQQDAFLALQKLALDNKNLPHGICLFQDHWHQGVTGIISSRIKDRFARPTIAFAKVNEVELKGSGRSIAGVHIRDVLDQVATENPGLLTRFGGHAMAAGVSLPIANFEKFAQAFDGVLSKILAGNPLDHVLYSDGELSSEILTLQTVEAVRALGPYGQAFTEPMFDGIFELVDQRLVGGRHLKLLLRAHNSESFIDAIAFNVDVDEWPKHDWRKARIAYRLDVNEFQNRRNLQLMVEHLVGC
ncbi:MAG: recJ [Gammaproteobacteria bacterium]|jgi:single-stranded-DNA-specific exonuclease|nr:recJ [Gammaproteobacteria bacterium]